MNAEDDRIQRHLEGALRMVRRRDVSRLSDAQRTVRAFVIQELERYRAARRFPRNTERTELTPVFIDPFGTRCAMAHLLEAVGAHSLVARVARDANLARIHDLATDPELLRWLAAMGLTVDEAARIQPGYCNYLRADCWCGGRLNLEGVESVVLATHVGRDDAGIKFTYRVDEVLAGSLVTPGQEVAIYDFVEQTDSGLVEQSLLALARTSTGEIIGFRSPIPTRGGGTSHGNCELAATIAAPPRDVLVNALMSSDCSAKLIAYDQRLAVNSCERDPNAVPQTDSGTTDAAQPTTAAESSSGCAFHGAAADVGYLFAVAAVGVVLARRWQR